MTKISKYAQKLLWNGPETVNSCSLGGRVGVYAGFQPHNWDIRLFNNDELFFLVLQFFFWFSFIVGSTSLNCTKLCNCVLSHSSGTTPIHSAMTMSLLNDPFLLRSSFVYQTMGVCARVLFVIVILTSTPSNKHCWWSERRVKSFSHLCPLKVPSLFSGEISLIVVQKLFLLTPVLVECPAIVLSQSSLVIGSMGD